MEWVWRYDQCWNSGCNDARLIYDEKTRTIRCPKCGEARTLSEEKWNDRQTLRKMLYDYMPGQYLFKNLSSVEIASLFLRKLEKMRWTHYVAHDYVLAKLKRDLEAQNRMKEAVRLMALNMDYDVEECMTLFPMIEDLEKSCDHIPYMIFDNARENFRVEGWRRREDETLHEGDERVGSRSRQEYDLHHEEWWFWDSYEEALRRIYFVYRANKDRVACWVTRELLRKVHYMIYGNEKPFLDIEMDPFPDGLIENILNGRKDTRDLQELTIQWYLDLAEKEINDKDNLSSSGAADDAILAVATKLGWKTVPNPFPKLDYVQELAVRLKDPEILQLYRAATNFNDLTDEDRMDAARMLVARVKGILAVQPSNKEKEKVTRYVS